VSAGENTVSKIYKALARAESERADRPSERQGRPADVVAPAATSRPRRSREPYLDVPVHRQDYEKLKIMLTLEAARSELKTVMLASALAGEGVSTVVLGLAATMAEGAAQGVLVIDLNSANPDLADRLGLSPTVGLGELLAKDTAPADAIVESPIPRLFLLGQGKVSSDFSQPGSLALFEELLRSLRSQFDYVILDGGALRSAPDSLLVSGKVDGVVLVVQAERTGSDVVRDASDQLRMAGANLLGAVLNRRRNYLPKFLARRL
jgi:capsular exopolysaccharide synthesis family protein